MVCDATGGTTRLTSIRPAAYRSIAAILRCAESQFSDGQENSAGSD